MTNTLYSFVAQGISDELTQARFDRARNSKLFLMRNRVIKSAKSGQIEREFKMLTSAKDKGINVPSVTQIDDCTLSLQFLPHGETLWDYIQHNKTTPEIYSLVRTEIHKMWRAGIIHGDLHCNNIIISSDKVYIIDMASSWNTDVLIDTFGNDNYSQDILDGINSDKQALTTSIKECKQLIS